MTQGTQCPPRLARGAAIAIALAMGTNAANATPSQGVYQEQDGLLVVEFESITPTEGEWAGSTSTAGYTGDGYVLWTGPNHFGSPGHGTFGIQFEIHQPGAYDFRIRNYHDHPDSTEENDVWVRVDGGSWIKHFSSQNNYWTWATNMELSDHEKPPARYELDAGVHTMEFSGRSFDFRMDRFHLFRPGHPDGDNLSVPESDTAEINRRPVPAIRIAPTSIPAGDNYSTVVTLDARGSMDPDDDELSFEWALRGARFVEGTHSRSPVARVLLEGSRAMPVRLVVRDDADPPLSRRTWDVINIEDGQARLGGELVAWHPMDISLNGPSCNETDDEPNPFLDFRMITTFTGPEEQQYRVHGFFDGDGMGGDSGDVWRTRFTPDMGGIWSYEVSFRAGPGVALSPGINGGSASHFNGASGNFYVMNRDPESDGFQSQGRLEYVGEHYLKFRDGSYFIKGGTDSPENFLAYNGFDDVQDHGGVGIIHEYAGHATDWELGDPYWESVSGDAKGIIGALNYLGKKHVNSVYFLPMNLGGDGQDTYPFIGGQNTEFNKCHYDISRMHQWNQVFDHAQRQGVMLHVVLAETESPNENWLDNGNLGAERKLFFRELIARFGHALALKWNLSEENDYSVSKLIEFAEYIDGLDPYDHPITVHTHPNNFQDYEALVGNPLFTTTSIQYNPDLANNHVEAWREHSANAGHKWVLDMDENNPYHTGLTNSNADDLRKRVLYDVYFSGGQVEWYGGYHNLPLGGDLRMEDFGTRAQMWDYMWYARRLMQQHLPFWEMEPADDLLDGENGHMGGGQVLAKHGEYYAIYLPNATSTGQIDLSGTTGRYRGRWFNPRTGEFQGPFVVRSGGNARPLGAPPAEPDEDWVLLLKNARL